MSWGRFADNSGQAWEYSPMGLWILCRQYNYNKLLKNRSHLVPDHHAWSATTWHVQTNFSGIRAERETLSQLDFNRLEHKVANDTAGTFNELVLIAGNAGIGTVTITNNGSVTSTGTTFIGATGVVNLNGGRFDFGNATIQTLERVNATSGSMLGTVFHSGTTDVSTWGVLQNPGVDQKGGTVVNTGTLHGDAALGVRLTNTGLGVVNIVVAEHIGFAGQFNYNGGVINNVGGLLSFGVELDNASGGLVNGRG